MIEIEESDSIKLESGDVISCKKITPTSYFGHVEETSYQIEVDGIVDSIVKTFDESLFNMVKEGTIAILNDLFMKGVSKHFDSGNNIFAERYFTKNIYYHLIRMKLNPVETAFAGFFLYFSAMSYENTFGETLFTDEEIVFAVRRHIKNLEEVNPTSNFELITLLDSFNSQLGFKNVDVVINSEMKQKDIVFFRDNPDLFILFLQLTTALDEGFKNPNMTISSIEVSYPFIIKDNNLLSSMHFFRTCPTHQIEFVEEFRKIKVHEARKIYNQFSVDVSENNTVDLLHYLLENHNSYLSEPTFRESKELYDVIFEKTIGSLKSLEKVSELHSIVMELSSTYPAFRKFFIQYCKEVDESVIENVDEVHRVIACIYGFDNDPNWVHCSAHAYCLYDYTLMKLCEKIGGYKAISSILLMVESDSKMTFDQWMDFADRYDDFRDIPVDWWSSLLGDF